MDATEPPGPASARKKLKRCVCKVWAYVLACWDRAVGGWNARPRPGALSFIMHSCAGIQLIKGPATRCGGAAATPHVVVRAHGPPAQAGGRLAGSTSGGAWLQIGRNSPAASSAPAQPKVALSCSTVSFSPL